MHNNITFVYAQPTQESPVLQEHTRKRKETLVMDVCRQYVKGMKGEGTVGFWKGGKKGLWALGNKETKPPSFFFFFSSFH